MRRTLIIGGGVLAVILISFFAIPLLIALLAVSMLTGGGSDNCSPSNLIVTTQNTSGIGLAHNGPIVSTFYNRYKSATQDEMRKNAQIIYDVGVARAPDGATQRDIMIAIATAIQESDLINIAGGDRDSLGLFQQRPSQGWGTPAQIMDPVYAANKFYDTLLTVDSRELKPMITVAMEVQRPNRAAYEKRWNWDAVVTEMIGGASALQASESTRAVQVVSAMDPICDTLPMSNTTLAVQSAIDQVGKPYSWSKGDTNGYDGSGLYHWAYAEHEIDIPRTAIAQYEQLENVSLDSLQAGDLVFWKTSEADTTVAMYIGSERVIKSTGPSENIVIATLSTDNAIGAVRPITEPEIVLAANAGTGEWQLPLKPGTYRVGGSYGQRIHPITGIPGLHSGADFPAPYGTPIYAVANGTVSIAGKSSGGNTGYMVAIEHSGGVQSRYVHPYKDQINVRVGDQVVAGQKIAGVGSSGNSTGNHLHFEIRVNGKPVDPVAFMAERGVRF